MLSELMRLSEIERQLHFCKLELESTNWREIPE